MREAVFDPFVRVESSRSRDTGGSGLGYGIARAVSGGAAAQAQDAGAPLAGPAVVISGSCSVMTNRQVAA